MLTGQHGVGSAVTNADTVACLALAPTGHVLSGSWDQTAIVWGTGAADNRFNYLLDSADRCAQPDSHHNHCIIEMPF